MRSPRFDARGRCAVSRMTRTGRTRTGAGRTPAAPLAVRALGGRIYYGWILVVALAVTATIGYGILTYAFPVFLAPMGEELGWSRSTMTGAFSLGMLASGAAAPAVGRWLDRRGPRALMTVGSILACALLLAWSRVHGLVGYYLVWVGLGAVSAAVLYEPAFAVVANWFEHRRGRALTVLTFIGGFASIIFVPLATWLVETVGWRSALVALAAIMAIVAVPLHALLLHRRPEDVGLVPDGGSASRAEPHGTDDLIDDERPHGVPADSAVRSRSFRWLAVAFGVSMLTTTAVSVHLIPLLLERGHGAGFAGAAMGALGVAALPGRLIFTPLGDRLPRAAVTASIFALQALGVLVLLTGTGPAAVWFFVALFGAGFGAITPARAALLADFYGSAAFGSINGTLSFVLSAARAAAPVGASLFYDAAGGYPPVLWTLLALTGASAVGVLRAGRAAARPTR